METPIKIKIDLKDLPHKCNRTLLVPRNVNMHQLHFCIQVAMGWENAHLFQFSEVKWNSKLRVGIPDDFDMGFGGPETVNAHKVSLEEVFLIGNGAKPFWYWYDFGDDWWHRISFLKTSKKDQKSFGDKPLCTKAEGKCPPEDIGGVWGYATFLEVIKNPKHPDYNELISWHRLENPNSYNEMETDLNAINEQLTDYYESLK